jgi:tricarballylate dehydrogenase
MGIAVRYGAEVTALEIADGAIRTISIAQGAHVSHIHAKTVVLAAGGFEANLAGLKAIWGDAADNFIIRGTPYNTGTVLKLMLDAGAQPVGDPSQFHAVAIDARAPKFDGGIVTRLDCVPFSIVVDRSGERFYDEGEDVWPKRYAIWGRLVAQQPDQIAYSIIDSKAERLFMPSVFPAIRADSIAELATKLGLDPAALERTIAAFNAAVQPGDFDSSKLDNCHTEGLTPPKTNWARRIDTPPFIGYPLRPGITFTYLGVRVNERAQVLMQNGTPATNLWASGEIMAGNILGRGYLAGFGMAIGTVFGRIAGREAARYAHN